MHTKNTKSNRMKRAQAARKQSDEEHANNVFNMYIFAYEADDMNKQSSSSGALEWNLSLSLPPSCSLPQLLCTTFCLVLFFTTSMSVSGDAIYVLWKFVAIVVAVCVWICQRGRWNGLQFECNHTMYNIHRHTSTSIYCIIHDLIFLLHF